MNTTTHPETAMAAAEAIPPADLLATLVPLEQIRQKARELGVVKRRRKVDVAPFLLFVVLTLCGRHGQSLAGLRQAWTLKSGVTLARSAFQARFSASFEKLVGWLLEAMETRAQGTRAKMHGVLAPFRDVVAIDATVIGVHASLASKWKGTKGAAGVKVHTWVRAHG
ncbi:MAG: hypothetical protein H6740_12445 [Alphaproteobacteria bacterium]|nr:hypothetical protein [Alphaproteobacteria bacterium]